MALGVIAWWGVSRLADRPVYVDTRVTPSARLTFSCWCELEVSTVRLKLQQIEMALKRQQLIAERGTAAAQRHADAWDEVEARSPYRLGLLRPRPERRVTA